MRITRPATQRPAPVDVPAAGERWIYGRHAVAAALANPARRWHRLVALAGQEAEARRLAETAAARRLGAAAVELRDRKEFAAILPESAVHQGLALMVEPLAGRDLDDVLRAAAPSDARSVIVVLDDVSDPHNVGAVLRSAAAFGAHAVVVGHSAPPATGVLAKAASGALEIVPLIRAGNTARALDRLKAAGFWICGLDETAGPALAELDLGRRVGLVLGSEGRGMRRLVRERCDYLARLPTSPLQPTLNISNAAAVALYELGRDCAHKG
ncbi:MAG TPA: 23S rRNA (guanosine(2251)-2'-O)-methyltransferase RlmB [Stellaceae bacterium]|jgi:23S rRNA (guanosine2251-2'-O)-methyltransferase